MNNQDPRNNFDLPLKAPVPNKLGAYMAGLLRQGKEGANNLNAFGIGAGDLIFGDSPKAAEEMSYGNIPHKGSGQTYQLDPSVADLGMLVSAPTAGTIKATQQGGKAMGKVLREGVDAPFDQSRRKALKIGAGVTAAVSSPALALKALREGGQAAMPKASTVVKSGAKAVGKSARTSMVLAKDMVLAATKWLGKEGVEVSDEVSDEVVMPFVHYVEKNMMKYGSDFDVNGFVTRNDPNASRLSQGLTKNPTKKANDWLYELDDDYAKGIVEDWMATGKWPDDLQFMKGIDVREWLDNTNFYNNYGASPHEELLAKKLGIDPEGYTEAQRTIDVGRRGEDIPPYGLDSYE